MIQNIILKCTDDTFTGFPLNKFEVSGYHSWILDIYVLILLKQQGLKKKKKIRGKPIYS